MIQYELLNASPMSDTFANLYTKWNANFSIVPNEIIQVGNNVTFYDRDGDVFGEILLPLSPNVIITGLSASSVGFVLNVTAGDYQVANELKTIGATIQAIPAADLTYNRIDVLVVDETESYVYLTGVASANPVAPTITLNQLAVTYINVPASGIPVITPNTCCIPNGTTNGQTIRWNQSTNLWEINNKIISTDATLYLRGDTNFDIGTEGVTNRSFVSGDDFNLSMGVQNGLGVWNELLISGSSGFDFNEGATESRMFVGCTGGISLISTVPTVQTDVLWNDGGLLYWNGDLICTAPCGGSLPTGTVDFSTLRYDLGGGVWVENLSLLAKDNFWTLISTKSCSVTHTPSDATLGLNVMLSSNSTIIDLHTDYPGLCTVMSSVGGSISHTSAPIASTGQCLLLGTSNVNILEELFQSTAINARNGNINKCFYGALGWSLNCNVGTLLGSFTTSSGVLFSFASNVTSTAGNSNRSTIFGGNTCTIDSGSTCGVYTCDASSIVSVHANSTACIIIGCDTATIESGQTCGVYSCFGGDIKGYTGVGAVRCINSVILGGVSNTIDPTGSTSCSNLVVIGGSNNNITGGLGNCLNSAIISSSNSTITPVGAGNRIVVIGLNGFNATKNNTTYVDGIDTQGSHTYSSVTHVTTNTYNIVAGDHIIACLNTALFVTQTIYLPATPNEGDTYIIENPDGTAGGVGTITIDGNGNNVNGGLTVLLNTAYVSKTARYYAGTVNAWIVGM